MSKIVFFCIPAHGHTNPTLGVVKELVNRGHEVWYYSYNTFKEKIENTGAKFISCDIYDVEKNLKPEDAAKIGKDLAFSTKILVDTTLALDEMVCRDMESLKPDCIVADSMAVWGKAIAIKLNIPFVSSTTTFAFNQYSAKIMRQSISQMLNMIFSMSKVNKDLKRLQDKGYPIDNILSIIQNDNETNTIVYTSKEFQPCAETFSEKYSFVGPSIRETTENIQKGEKKLLYISLGTVNNIMLNFYKNCITALKDSEYQVIMSVGNNIDPEKLGEIPSNFEVYHSVDQIAVLQKADAFLTHCGMNSVNEALYYEVPLILFPQTSEQGGVARQVSNMEAGIYLLKNNIEESNMLNENLLTLRKLHKLSQEDVAEKIGVSRQAVAKWENGETAPDIYNCKALADLFDVSLDDLVNFSSENTGLPVPPKGKYIFGVVTVGEKGQIVIPKKARDVFDLKAGDGLVILGDEEQGLAMIKASAMMNLMQNISDFFGKDK